MRQPNLDPHALALLMIGIITLICLMLIRVARIVASRRAHRYPGAWTTEQIKLFEQLRVCIGVGLIVTWVSLWLAEPRMPQGWPFGFEQILLTVGLLFLSDAWLSLLGPDNWERSLLSRLGFRSTFVVIALVWIAVLSGLVVTIQLVAVKPQQVPTVFGTFA